MMHIKMDETRRGDEGDGVVKRFYKDVVYYDVSHTLACHFVRNKWCHEASLAEMDEQIERVRRMA